MRKSFYTCGQLAELVETVEDGAIFADVEPLHLLVVLAHVVRTDGPEETDVVVGMKLCHFLLKFRIVTVLMAPRHSA
jgi:hypothetical protein